MRFNFDVNFLVSDDSINAIKLAGVLNSIDTLMPNGIKTDPINKRRSNKQ